MDVAADIHKKHDLTANSPVVLDLEFEREKAELYRRVWRNKRREKDVIILQSQKIK